MNAHTFTPINSIMLRDTQQPQLHYCFTCWTSSLPLWDSLAFSSRRCCDSCFTCFWYKYVSFLLSSRPQPPIFFLSAPSPSLPQVVNHIDIWWAAANIRAACDALQDVFQKGLRSYVTVSGLRRCHVLIKIQIPCIDCVIRLVQPGPAVLIRPVIYDHLQKKSFCVIIWGNRGWMSVILWDLFCIMVLVVDS